MQDVLVVSAHPDDETIGASTLLGSAVAIVHVTDGAPRNMYDAKRYGFATAEQYAAARRRELQAALRRAGVSPQLIEIGVPDQQATFEIPRIVQELRRIIHRVQPGVVLTHPYEGGHPDHDACALAVRIACTVVPVHEYACYHNDRGNIRTGEFLPLFDDVQTVTLNQQQQSTKQAMFDCFETQREMLKLFPVAVERFRTVPNYDFTQPPHDGTLYYEQFDWGMTGERFRTVARQMLELC